MRRVVGRRGGAVALLLCACLGLVSCGDDEPVAVQEPTSSASDQPGEETTSESPSAQAVPPGTPACSEIWSAGAELPRVYKGCEDDGAFVKADGLGCSSGQKIVRYADQFYGVLGGTIHETGGPLEKDRDYQASVRSCRA